VNVSIFGLGYVGTVSAACLARNHHTVIGVDTSDYKVECINAGTSPIVEPGIDALLKEGAEHGRLTATKDASIAISRSDLTLICVGTPSNPNGSLNLEYVMRVGQHIGACLRTKDSFHTVVVRSTVLPGTVEKVAVEIEQASGKRRGKDFGIASNPEFLREGTSLYDFEHPPYTVIGAEDDRVADQLKELYRAIQAPFFRVKIREAELLKYACNAFHATKVTFGNEIGAIAKELGIDSHVVMKLFCEDTKLNISAAYLKPGFAFGGSCLPKDVRAITHAARSLDVSAPMLNALIPSNDHQIDRAVEWVLSKKKKRIGVLGLSFKSDTDDMRESPMVRLVETLHGKGCQVSIYDSNVHLSRVLGANRSYIEQEIPHISLLLKASLEDVITGAEVVIVGNKGQGFLEALEGLGHHVEVLDLVRLLPVGKKINARYEGIAW
jgi:GDP-mannose 6-dehydrogenase